MNKKEKSIKSRIVGLVLDVLLIVMVLYICTTLYLRKTTGNAHASIFGITTHIVISESMEPNINKNDIIIVKRADSYSVGDVITYINEDGLSITHRIISIQIGGYIVQGDANPHPDAGIIANEQVVGKMVYIIPVGS